MYVQVCCALYLYLSFLVVQVSWGTKGSDKVEALPQVSSKKPIGDAHAVVTDTVRDKDDVEATFNLTVARAVAKPVKEKSVDKPTMDVRVQSYFQLLSPSSQPLLLHRTKTRRSVPV